MITADEAREIKRHHFEAYIRELANIEQKIRRAAWKGKTKINLKGLLYSETKAMLERSGYKIAVEENVESGRNELYTTISWGKERNTDETNRE